MPANNVSTWRLDDVRSRVMSIMGDQNSSDISLISRLNQAINTYCEGIYQNIKNNPKYREWYRVTIPLNVDPASLTVNVDDNDIVDVDIVGDDNYGNYWKQTKEETSFLKFSPVYKKVIAWYREADSVKFFVGDKVTLPDEVNVTYLRTLKRVSLDADLVDIPDDFILDMINAVAGIGVTEKPVEESK